MGKCAKCGKEFEDNAIKCSNCDSELKTTNIIEEVQVDPNSIISLDDEETSNNIASNSKVTTSIVEDEKAQDDSTIDKIETPIVKSLSSSLVDNQIDPIITNSELETVSVDTNSFKLEEERIEQTNISIPDLPAPMIGEINPDLLGNNYEEAERINNEKIAIKEQEELAELERKRQEAELAKQNQTSRPDLLAELNNVQINMNPIVKKKRKVGKVILIVVILGIIAFALYYFLVLSK